MHWIAGESRAAMARIANGTHEQISLNAGDTVIYSSRQIPGNEQAIGRVHDALLRQRVKLITDEDAPVHVSGHPSRDELTEMYSLVRPKIAIPVHGTARHLMAHAELATDCQVGQTLIPENGDMVKFKAGRAEINGQAPTGLLTHEGGEVVDLQSDFLRSRRRMLWNGTVTVSVVLSNSGDLLMAPHISQSGLCSDIQADEFIADASLAVEDALMQSLESAEKGRSDEQIVISAVRSLAKRRFRLRPTVHAHILRASDEELRGVIGRINHIAIAVSDIRAAMAQWQARTGAEISAIQTLPEHGVHVAFIQAENGKVELLEPIDSTSPIAKFLKAS